jgi:hypothetical protein
MRPHDRTKTGRNKTGRARSWIVCAVLAASLWRGPVPWIHSHEMLEAQGLPEAALAWHLRHLHPHESGHEIFGWHVHLTYPWDISNEPALPADPNAPKPRVTYDMPYVVSPAPPAVDVDRHASSWLSVVPLYADATVAVRQMDPPSLAGRHFPAIHPPSVSLRALICIALC